MFACTAVTNSTRFAIDEAIMVLAEESVTARAVLEVITRDAECGIAGTDSATSNRFATKRVLATKNA
jgi:hypothetical protein